MVLDDVRINGGQKPRHHHVFRIAWRPLGTPCQPWQEESVRIATRRICGVDIATPRRCRSRDTETDVHLVEAPNVPVWARHDHARSKQFAPWNVGTVRIFSHRAMDSAHCTREVGHGRRIWPQFRTAHSLRCTSACSRRCQRPLRCRAPSVDDQSSRHQTAPGSSAGTPVCAAAMNGLHAFAMDGQICRP